MKKILMILSGFLLLLVLGATIFIGRFKTRALPDYNKDVKLAGLTSGVTVIRDSFAIPHIYAESEHDLYMAAGYAMAQDRLWQMDLLRRVTQGRLSEIFGKDLVDTDVLFRALRFTEKSRRIFGQADEKMRSCIISFSDGVNQFILQAGKRLPPEFGLLGYRPEPWLPEHSLNLIGYMAWDLSSGWSYEVLLDQMRQKLGPDLSKYMIPNMDSVHRTATYPGYKLDKPAAVALAALSKTASVVDDLGLDVFRGSNNWAVSGKKSITGKPLLANDMHLGLNIPGIWYQMHEVIPGKLNVTGVVLPGQPLIVAGHNDSIAWGFTNVQTDDADFYQETINPKNPDQYLFNGSWKDMIKVKEKILIKGGDRILIYPGETDRYDWKGLVPFDELPFTYNPECGYVASANCKAAPEDYPYYISDWYSLPYREDRIIEMLNEKDKLSSDDFKKMQGDQKSKMAEKFTRYFLSHLIVKSGLSQSEKQVYNLMRKWNYTLLKDRPEGLVFEKWYYLTGLNLVRDQMDSLMLAEFIGEKTFFENFLENMLVMPSDAWADDISTKDVTESFGDMIGLSFRQTVKELTALYGSNLDDWKWGDAHTFTLKHPMSSVKIIDRVLRLNRGPYPVGGSFHTVGPYTSPLNNNSGVNNGASERHIFDAGNWDRSLTVIPTGTSGIPASRHYCDQTASYIANKYHTDYVTRQKVEGAGLYRMKFVPQ